MAIKHQAFLDLEESLASRLRNAWAQYWGKVSAEIVQLTAQGHWDEAHKVAEAIDLGPLFTKHRAHARTVGMSALLLGASRLRSIRDSRIAKAPPLKELDAFLAQTETMLARNASQALRLMAHEWIEAEEQAQVMKFDPGQPRDERGRWVDWLRSFERTKTIHAKDGTKLKVRWSQQYTPPEHEDGEYLGGTLKVYVDDPHAGIPTEEIARLPYGESFGQIQIGDLWVAPQWRRQGLATQLFNMVRASGVPLQHFHDEAQMSKFGRAFAASLPVPPESFESAKARLSKGDYPGHPFRGNQYTNVVGNPGIHTIRVKRQKVQVIVNPARSALARFAADIGQGRLLRYLHLGKESIWWNAADATHWQMIEALRLYEEGKKYKDSELWSGDSYQIGNPDYKLALARMDEFGVYKADWREEDHPRGKTTPESTPGSFAPRGEPVHGEVAAHIQNVLDGASALRPSFHTVRPRVVFSRRSGVEYDPFDDEMRFPAYGADQPLAVVDREYDAKNPKGYVAGSGIRAFLLHEYAHAIDHYIRRGVTDDDFLTEWHEAKKALRREVGDPTEYSRKEGLNEWVAERFLWEVMGNAEPRLLDLLDRFVKLRVSKSEGHEGTLPQLSEVAKREASRNQVKINVAGKNYFGLASSIQVSRLSAFGFLAEAAESGLKSYRIDAVLDEKTCEVCRHMDGWVFPVEQGMALAQQIMDTDDPDTLKQLAPFYAQNKASLAALATYGTDDFIDVGMSLPPFHPLCRCILTPTDEAPDVHPTDVSDRVALASQALYGEGDGVRLTRDLFGVEQLPDEQTTVAPPTEDEARITDLLEQVLREPPTAPRERWIPDTAALWAVPPPTDVQPSALVSPQPFEGTTIPRKWTEPFDPQRLAALASSKWPWLAGILGWLALREHRQPSDFDPGDAEEDDEEDELP